MEDTVESLRVELDQLRAEFNAFMAYAMPVIDSHQPPPEQFKIPVSTIPTLPLPEAADPPQ